MMDSIIERQQDTAPFERPDVTDFEHGDGMLVERRDRCQRLARFGACPIVAEGLFVYRRPFGDERGSSSRQSSSQIRSVPISIEASSSPYRAWKCGGRWSSKYM